MRRYTKPAGLREVPPLYCGDPALVLSSQDLFLLPPRAMLTCASGTRGVDRHRIRHECIYAYRSVCRLVMLYITVNIFVETFDENTHELIVVKDVSALQLTLGQLVGVLLDPHSGSGASGGRRNQPR